MPTQTSLAHTAPDRPLGNDHTGSTSSQKTEANTNPQVIMVSAGSVLPRCSPSRKYPANRDAVVMPGRQAEQVEIVERPGLGDEDHSDDGNAGRHPGEPAHRPVLDERHPAENDERAEELHGGPRANPEAVERPVERHAHQREVEAEHRQQSKLPLRAQDAPVPGVGDEDGGGDERPNLRDPGRRNVVEDVGGDGAAHSVEGGGGEGEEHTGGGGTQSLRHGGEA